MMISITIRVIFNEYWKVNATALLPILFIIHYCLKYVNILFSLVFMRFCPVPSTFALDNVKSLNKIKRTAFNDNFNQARCLKHY